jgi:peptide deformylase
MTRLRILGYPDPRLRRKAEAVTDFGPELQRLVDDMFETMYATRSIGLAATQVDAHRQVIVMDVSGRGTDPQVFINPQILSRRGLGMVEEGCLSLPGVNESVKRAMKVRVRSLDRQGVPYEHDLEEMLAVCLQHEMDHLAGMLFIDRLSFWRKLRLRAKSEGQVAALQ